MLQQCLPNKLRSCLALIWPIKFRDQIRHLSKIGVPNDALGNEHSDQLDVQRCK